MYIFIPPADPSVEFTQVQDYNAQTFTNYDTKSVGTNGNLKFTKRFPSDGSNGQNPLFPGVPAFIGMESEGMTPLDTNVLILKPDCKTPRTSFPQ
jgi:hypothetical protein